MLSTSRRPLLVAAALTALVVVSAASPAAGQRSVFEIEARQWSAEPTGSFAVTQGPILETLDLQSDLALDEDDSFEGRLTLRPTKSLMIRVGYLPEIGLAGDSVVSRSFSFLNQVFAFDERVITAFDVEYGRVGFAWQFSGKEGLVRIGPIIEAKGFRADLALSAPDASPPVLETDKYEAAFGAAGLVGDVKFTDRVEAFGEYTTSVTGDEGDITETEFGVRYLAAPKIAIIAGVRSLEIEVRDANSTFVFELDGIFFGASARF